MTRETIFQLMNSHPVFHLATVENGKPKCRAMFLYRADERGIIFSTLHSKDVHQQILQNPEVEACFNDAQKGIQVRASGIIETVNNNALKDEIFGHPSRAFLKPMREAGVFKDFYNDFIVYNLKNTKALVWTLQTTLAPKEYIDL